MNKVLKFRLGKSSSKVPGCSGARPVKSLGNSELPLKNLCENGNITGEWKTVFLTIASHFDPG